MKPCAAGTHGSARCVVLSRAHIYGYGRSLRPPQGTSIASRRRAPFRQALQAPVYHSAVSPWVLLGVLLAVASVIVVALPFLRRPGITAAEDSLARPDALERRRLELSEERDRSLAALKELEFDHRTGKISDEDYRELVGPLRRRAAEALRALEPRSRESARARVRR